MDLHIEVTAAHIDAGEREQCDKCPIALAVREVLPARFDLIAVDCTGITARELTDNRSPLRPMFYDHFWRLPQSAQDFIHVFDVPTNGNEDEPEYAPVYPFSFTAHEVEP